jgi:hypothetical protein
VVVERRTELVEARYGFTVSGDDRIDVDEQDGWSLMQRMASAEWRIILAGLALRTKDGSDGWVKARAARRRPMPGS